MQTDPEMYKLSGLKALKPVLDDEANELISEGTALDTAALVKQYADYRVKLIQLYGSYRMQRKALFTQEKTTILEEG